MMTDGQRAVEALDHFYQAGFDIIRDTTSVNGFFFSDAGLLFAPGSDAPERQLESLLRVVRQLNEKMLEYNIMLTTSIAWGEFSYHNRIEFHGISKLSVYGNAYVAAYLDNGAGEPKLQSGQCRIIQKNLPPNVLETIEQRELLRAEKAHHYYYWMLNDNQDIQIFQRRYKNAKYAGILDALRKPRG